MLPIPLSSAASPVEAAGCQARQLHPYLRRARCAAPPMRPSCRRRGNRHQPKEETRCISNTSCWARHSPLRGALSGPGDRPRSDRPAICRTMPEGLTGPPKKRALQGWFSAGVAISQNNSAAYVCLQVWRIREQQNSPLERATLQQAQWGRSSLGPKLDSSAKAITSIDRVAREIRPVAASA